MLKYCIVTIGALLALNSYALPVRAATEPCNILTMAQASKALGQPVVRTQERDLGHPSCSYKSARFSSLVVTVEDFSSRPEARNAYRASVTSPSVGQLPSIKLSGIGDAAQRMGATILVLKRNSVYGFTIVAPDASSAGPLRVIDVLRSVAPRL